MGRYAYDTERGLMLPRRAEPLRGRPLLMSAPQQALVGYGAAAAGPTIASANVVMLLQMDGTGSTFTDSGPNNLTVTAAGAATQTTTTGAFGGGKALVCGANTSDYIGVAANSVFNLTDFEINFRVKFTTDAASILSFIDIGGYDVGLSLRWGLNNNLQLGYYYKNGNEVDSANQAGISPADWAEVAISRQSGTVRTFFKGALLTTNTGLNWTFQTTPAIRIGNVLSGGANNNVARSFDDMLIANTAIHTAAYTPRSAAWSIV